MTRLKTRFALLFGLVSALLCSVAAAGKIQERQSIITAAEAFLTARVEADYQGDSQVRMGRLDSRLRLAACSGNLEAFLPPGGKTRGSTTVGVRCPDEGGWTIYVSAKVSIFGDVLVSTRPIPRGDTVTAADVQLARRDLAALPQGYLVDQARIIGYLAKRSINPDTVLSSSAFQAPRLVRRGEKVTLVAETPGFAVTMMGKSLTDGSSGERVRVRAGSSRRVIEGVVVSEGVVKVTL